MTKLQFQRTGFSLLELTIVLVIITTLIIGISFSSNLITQAKIRRLAAELSEYSIAIDSFRDKYNGIPGDFENGFAIWGANCATTASLCNGNGDKIINYNGSSTNDSENLRAWQHLVLASMIPGHYSGTSAVAGESNIGINIPASSWTGAGLELYTEATTPAGVTGLALQVSGYTKGSYAHTANAMTPLEAMALDIKRDDGIGKSGALQGFFSGQESTCIGPDGVNYNISNSNKICYIRYYLIYS